MKTLKAVLLPFMLIVLHCGVSSDKSIKPQHEGFSRLKIAVMISTTSAYVYIRKGNEVFRLPEMGALDWEGYINLVKAVDPPWPKMKLEK